MKMAALPTENKQFTERLDADPIFMQGGAPTAHEVLSECGFLGPPGVKFPHLDNTVYQGLKYIMSVAVAKASAVLAYSLIFLNSRFVRSKKWYGSSSLAVS